MNHHVYSFKCTKCGEHQVAQTTFDAHVTPSILQKIGAMDGVTKVRLVFKDGCPLCLEQGKTHTRPADVEVAVRRKVTHLQWQD